MELFLFSKHTVNVCACAVSVRLISVFSVKVSARTTEKPSGYSFLTCGRGWGRAPLISLDIKGREVWGLPQKERELPPCLYPYLQEGWSTQTWPHVHLPLPLQCVGSSVWSQLLCFGLSDHPFQRWAPCYEFQQHSSYHSPSPWPTDVLFPPATKDTGKQQHKQLRALPYYFGFSSLLVYAGLGSLLHVLHGERDVNRFV